MGAIKFISWEFKKFFRLLKEFRNVLWIPKKSIDLEKLFTKYKGEKFFFIQVGANDGMTGDNLRVFIEKYNWLGIFVEPVPYVFKRLKKNYNDFSNLMFENSAISNETGFAKFFSIAEKDLANNNLFENFSNYRLDQLSSFDKDTLMKHSYMHPDFEKLIKEINIPTLTLSDLIKKYNVKKIDLLQLDTEGFDFEILKSIDFESVSPAILIFEHQHMRLCDYKAILKKIKKGGYTSYKYNWDTVSIKRDVCFGN